MISYEKHQKNPQTHHHVLGQYTYRIYRAIRYIAPNIFASVLLKDLSSENFS